MDNAVVFIEKYKKLEELVSHKYNLKKGASPIAFLESRREFANISDKLSYCREVRNFLQHEPKIDKEFAIIPSSEMITLIDDIIEYIENPLRCSQICIKLEDMYYCKLNDRVLDSLIGMNHYKYSHIPIMENGVLVGVFSKTSLFNYMLHERKYSLEKDTRFIDIMKYIDPNGDGSEHYEFSKIEEKVENIKKTFEINYKKAIKIAIVFLTENGLRNEKVLGMITPYDLIK